MAPKKYEYRNSKQYQMTEIPMTKTREIKSQVKNCPFILVLSIGEFGFRICFVFRASDFVFILTYSVRNGMTFSILILINRGGFRTIEGINKGEQFRDDNVQIRRDFLIDVKL